MVDSGTVKSDASSLNNALKTCNSSINDLSGSWEGKSYKNLKSKFSEFYGEASSVKASMDSFASALDLYEEYKKEKKKYEDARDEYNSFKSKYNNADEDSAHRGYYKSKMISCDREADDSKEKMDQLKKQINEALSSAKKGKLAGAKAAASEPGPAKVPTMLDPDGFSAASNIVERDGNMVIDCDYDGLIDLFGGQLDDHGPYGKLPSDCDDYSRGYAFYILTGKVIDHDDAGVGGMGYTKNTDRGENRTDQARIAYEYIKKTGKPCIVHVNSSTGRGHWLCTVGYKSGTTKDTVTMGDLIVVDSAAHGDKYSAKFRPMSEESVYCSEGTGNCAYEPGYQVIHYDK